MLQPELCAGTIEYVLCSTLMVGKLVQAVTYAVPDAAV